MTSTVVEDVLKDLERQRDQIDPVAAEAEARRIADAVATRASEIDNKIVTIKQSMLSIRSHDAQIGAVLAWHETLTAIRAQLSSELLALPPRIRDARTLGVQQSIALSIKSIDVGLQVDRFQLNTLRLGQLLAEAGHVPGPTQPGQTFGEAQWFGDLKTIEKRLAKLRADRSEAEARLAEATMSDADRAARLNEVKARNAAPRKKQRADGSTYLKHADGSILELDEATTQDEGNAARVEASRHGA